MNFQFPRWVSIAFPLTVYVGVYILLSLGGSYLTVNHGGDDWERSWCPSLLVRPYLAPSGRRKAYLSLAGALYWPLLAMDRLLWHRSQEPFWI